MIHGHSSQQIVNKSSSNNISQSKHFQEGQSYANVKGGRADSFKKKKSGGGLDNLHGGIGIMLDKQQPEDPSKASLDWYTARIY